MLKSFAHQFPVQCPLVLEKYPKPFHAASSRGRDPGATPEPQPLRVQPLAQGVGEVVPQMDFTLE